VGSRPECGYLGSDLMARPAYICADGRLLTSNSY
jgi:hypothetical protein